MKKIYYQLTFRQTAPLRIGSGSGEQTDLDVLRDSRGMPFLPGSAIAGALRDRLPHLEAKRLMGDLSAPAPDGKTVVQESLLRVCDAVLPASALFTVQHRDGVGINERGTAIPGAKYDFEVVECNEPYIGVLELVDDVPDELETALETALRQWVRFGAHFGARTTRGYGSMTVAVRKKICEDLPVWLDFDPLANDAFADAEVLAPSDENDGAEIRLRAELRMQGSFTVRVNSAAPESDDAMNPPDLIPLLNVGGQPVIPGTSWAGTFRHHMLELAHDLALDPQAVETLFGSAAGQKERSRIRFGETAIEGSKSYVYTRNAVDRYTGAPRNQALFTERYAYGGTGVLEILLPAYTDKGLLDLLAVSMIDLDLGLLSAGGEGGVGRGVCEIMRLSRNGADVTAALKAQDASFLRKGDC